MKKMLCAAALLLSVGLAVPKFVHAEDAPATQPAKKKMGKKPKITFQPYKQLTDLTDEQVEKIAALHDTYLAEQADLKKKHMAEVDALLTDAQKEEVKKLEADPKKPTTLKAAKQSEGEQKAGEDGEKK